MNGDGNVCLSRPRPKYKKPTSTANNPMGTRYFNMRRYSSGCLGVGRSGFYAFIDGHTLAVAAIARGDQSTQRHDGSAQPDEAHHRFILQTETPRAIAQRLAHGHEHVAIPGSVDARFGQRALL